MVLFQPVSIVNSMPLKINYVLITVIITIIIISDPRAAICSILIQGEQETFFFNSALLTHYASYSVQFISY